MSKTTTKKPMTKAEFVKSLAEDCGCTQSEAAGFLNAVQGIMAKQLKTAGVFTLPGVAKFTVKVKPATAARKGRNPFTGEEMTFKAKPASKAVKSAPVKALKDAVA